MKALTLLGALAGAALTPSLAAADAAAHRAGDPVDVAPADPGSGEGRHMVTAGWLHIDTRPDSEPLHTTRVATGTTTREPGTSFDIDNGDTLGLTYTYAFSNHLSGQLVGGVPPVFHLSGRGNSALVGDLASYGNLAKVRQWTPTALALYTFGDPRQTVRPYIGLGVAYTRFTDVQLDPALRQAFVQAVQTRTAGAALSVGVEAEADDAWDPVATLGLEYRLREHWYGIASVSWLPLSTTATVTTTVNQSASPALPTGPFSRSEASMDIDPVVGFLGVGYRF
jgi:outer membrane protein